MTSLQTKNSTGVPQAQEAERAVLQHWIGRTSVLNDECTAAYSFLGIIMTQKVLGSISEVSRDSTKPTNMIAEQKNNFWKDRKNVIPP